MTFDILLTAIFDDNSGKSVPECLRSGFLGSEEVMLTTGAVWRAKLQSDRHHQQTNTRLFTGRMPFLSSSQQFQNTEGKNNNNNNNNSPCGLLPQHNDTEWEAVAAVL